MSSAQTIAYLATAASAITVGGSAPTVAPMYESVEALQAALDTQAVLMDFENAGNNSRGIRALLTAGIEGAEDETAIEDLYLVTPASTAADGKNRVMVEPIGSLTWTASATAVDGGRSGEKVPKSVSTSGTGRLASRTGIEIAVASALPAVATIYDIGPVRYLLRVPRVGTATGISPWEPPGGNPVCPRETSTTQAAKQLGVTPRVLQQWVKNRRAPHGHNPNGTRIRFDVGEVRAWAVQKGLLSASDQKAKAGNSKSGKRGRNTQGADSKSKPSKSKPKGGKGKPEPPDPPGDTPQVDTSPEGRRKTAFEILAKIPGLLSELNTSDGSLAASQVATAIKSAEATAAAMLRRLDLEAERDETLIDRNKAVRVAVEIGTIVSAGSKAAVVDLSDRLYDDLVAAGIKPGPREAFVRVVRGTIRDSEDKRMLEVGEAVRRAEVGLNGR